MKGKLCGHHFSLALTPVKALDAPAFRGNPMTTEESVALLLLSAAG
jgi:hypothetical protein